jgi:hypothetical protein
MRNRLFLGPSALPHLDAQKRGIEIRPIGLPVENFLLCSLAYLRKPCAWVNLPEERDLASSVFTISKRSPLIGFSAFQSAA